MEVDHSSQQVRPFVYIQYPTPPSRISHTNPSQQSLTGPQQSHITQGQQHGNPPPPKRKRQQVGYACDRCRERRVRCDRDKPICGQCVGKYDCGYSNHALRLDNVSMRQRMDDMQSTVRRMHDVLMRLEADYRDTVPRMLEQQQGQHNAQPPQPRLPPALDQSAGPNELLTTTVDMAAPAAAPAAAASLPPQPLTVYHQQLNPTIIDWAIGTGWQVFANNGLTSIHTNIASYEDLRDAVRRALHMTYQYQGPPLYNSPTCPQNTTFADDLPSFAAFEKLGRITAPVPRLTSNASSSSSSSPASSTSSSFASTASSYASSAQPSFPIDNDTDHLLETDVMTRLIHQHHQCGFPILVSPARFERHYKQGQLKSVVLSSIFCHIAPHACIYHPHLVHLQDFRTLGERFYDHSRTQLGLDDQSNLSNIHQRTLLIAYDLDLGRVRRAFLHLGVAIRMCFALDLHRPEGYVHCMTAFEREQAKRVFWTVWYIDTMVPHFFAQPSTIRNEDIKIEVPCVLADFDPTETDQTRFAISVINVRRISTESALRSFYRSLPDTSRCHAMASPAIVSGSFWFRRTFFCVLLDYCLLWINFSRPRLPRKSAIRRTSQAAFAMLALFSHWFRLDEHFDCFFRPYLYHYMCIIQIFKNNVTQKDGPLTPFLVSQSQAALVKLFHMYRATPTIRSFAESQLEKDLLIFIQQHNILTLAQLQYGRHQDPDPSAIDDLVDDPEHSDYYGWGIFSVVKGTNNNKTSTTGGSTSGGSNLSTSSSSLDLDNDNLYLS